MINNIIQTISNNSRWIDANVTLYTRLGTAGIRTARDDNRIERFVLEPVSVILTYALAITGAALATSTFLHNRFLNQRLDQFGKQLKKVVQESLGQRHTLHTPFQQISQNLSTTIDQFVRESKGMQTPGAKPILKEKLVKDIDAKIIKLTNTFAEHNLQYDPKVVKTLNDFRYMINVNKYVAFFVGSVFSAFVGGFAMPVIYETVIEPYILPALYKVLGKENKAKEVKK